jgi:hypothetical protein
MICHPSNFQIRKEGEGGGGPTILKREKQDDIHDFSHAYPLKYPRLLYNIILFPVALGSPPRVLSLID